MVTPDGPIFGCNLDLFIPGDGLVFINKRNMVKKGFGEGTSGKVADWVSTYGSVTFNLAGREWAFGGMNEAGLVLGAMELLDSRFPDRDERPPLPIGPWAQYVLDTCETVEDAIVVNEKVRIEDQGPPVHFLIADAKGYSVTIEWLDGKYVYHTGETLPVKALSNSIYETALNVYKRGGPRWWESDRGDTNERFAKAAERNAGYKDSGEPNAIKYAFETLTYVVAAPHTKWNIVYDIRKRQVFFRSAVSPTLKYLSFKDLDFSCASPLLMLDVNAAVEGDVSKAFQPYDYDVNLTVFLNLLARYNIEISKEDAEGLMHHFEEFQCKE